MAAASAPSFRFSHQMLEAAVVFRAISDGNLRPDTLDRIELFDDGMFVGEDEVTLDGIFQLAQVARPTVAGESLHEGRRDGQGLALVPGCDLAHEMLGERGNLLDALAQGGILRVNPFRR